MAAASSARSSPTPTTPPWRALRRPRRARRENPDDLPAALERALANAPALIDVATFQTAVSSDARKGLGFVPDYQPLTAWDDAERKRRGLG